VIDPDRYPVSGSCALGMDVCHAKCRSETSEQKKNSLINDIRVNVRGFGVSTELVFMVSLRVEESS